MSSALFVYDAAKFDAISGPRYSITLERLMEYEKQAPAEDPYKLIVCIKIINNVLELDWLLDRHYTFNDPTQLISLEHNDYKPLYSHILEAINCFKYIMAQGYPIGHSNDSGILSYHIIKNIMTLYYIDMIEVREFIKYYFSLLPAIEEDDYRTPVLLGMLLHNCTNIGHVFNIDMFKFMTDIFKSLNMILDYTFYDEIIRISNDEFDHEDPADMDEGEVNRYFEYFKAGIDCGFKISREQVCVISQICPAGKVYLDIAEFDKNLYYYRILYEDMIANYDEWYQLERHDIALASKVKARFVTNENIAQNGDSIVNRNLYKLADFIANYC